MIQAGKASAGGIMQAQGYKAEAKFKAHAHRYNEMLAKRNAQQARLGAQWAGIRGGIEQQDFLDEFHKFQGLVRANQGKSMAQINTGTSALVQLENAREADKNVAALKAQTSSQVLAQLERANAADIEAKTQRYYADVAIKVGKYKRKQALFSALLGIGEAGAAGIGTYGGGGGSSGGGAVE